MLVKELKPMAAIPEIELELVSIGEARPFATAKGEGQVASAAGKDSAGEEVKVSLWNEQINQVKEGDKVKITEGWCTAYKGQIQVSTGKRGKLEIL